MSDLIEVPQARVRVLPLALGGTAIWALVLVIALIATLPFVRDVAIAGMVLGAIGSVWARRMDRARPPRPGTWNPRP